MKGPLFYSKILLFGEYGIIEDSKGLSIPYNFYKGALKIPNKTNSISIDSNDILKGFLKYLKSLKIRIEDYILTRRFLKDMVLEVAEP